jgi:hypothetical protein
MAPRFSRVTMFRHHRVRRIRARVRDIVVCGHSRRRNEGFFWNPAALDDMPQVKSWLRHAKEARLALTRPK